MNVSKVPTFSTKEDAFDWMENELDHDCVDNHRFAYDDDQEDVAKYEQQRESGCCGFFDAAIMVDGRSATIGCNYGH